MRVRRSGYRGARPTRVASARPRVRKRMAATPSAAWRRWCHGQTNPNPNTNRNPSPNRNPNPNRNPSPSSGPSPEPNPNPDP